MQLAQISALLANANRDHEKFPEPFPLDDFRWFQVAKKPKVESKDDWKMTMAGFQAWTVAVAQRGIRKPS